MLRERASKLLQQARNRSTELSPVKAADPSKQGVSSLSQQNEPVKQNDAETKDSSEEGKAALISPNLKSNSFKLIKKRQLVQLSPQHFLKEKPICVDSGEV